MSPKLILRELASSCEGMSREMSCSAIEAESYSTTAAWSFVFAAWGHNQTCLSMCDLSDGALQLNKDGLAP